MEYTVSAANRSREPLVGLVQQLGLALRPVNLLLQVPCAVVQRRCNC